MGELRIGVSLARAPAMLRTIIFETLAGDETITIVNVPEGAFAPDCDAMVLADCPEPRRHLQGRVLGVAIFESRTGRGWLLCPKQPARSIDNQSLEALLELLHSAPKRSRWWSPRAWLACLMAPVRRDNRGAHDALPEPKPEPGVWQDDEPEKAQENMMPQLRVIPGAQQQLAALAKAPEPEPPPDPIAAELARIAARIAHAAQPRSRVAPLGEDLHGLLQTLSTAVAEGAVVRLAELERIANTFALGQDERDVLFMAAVVEIDPAAARLVALLNGQAGRTRPTPGLVARWGGDMRAFVERLHDEAPLLRYGLIALAGEGPVSGRPVVCDAAVWHRILGIQGAGNGAGPFALVRHEAPPTGLPDLIAPPAEREALGVAIARLGRREKRVLIAVVGNEDTGRDRMAEAIALHCAEARIVADGGSLASMNALGVLEREAALANACVILRDPHLVPDAVWAALNRRFTGPLLIICEPAQLGALVLTAGRAVTRFNTPDRDIAQRIRLWSALAPRSWDEADVRIIADRFDFGARRIAAALANASAQASAEGRGEAAPADALAACAMLRDTAFEGSAEPLEARYEAGEIVLRAETRRELDMVVAWARHGSRLFCKHGAASALHAGGGLACLFSGPPGTGKTMAAQIIARQIDYALYRVDLSQVIDKYIGEGEKRISKLFREASRSRVALFFDEADALFGKRSDVKSSHDRYANIAVNHLLQELEGFDGLAILATNYAANIDTAFLRRIRVKAEFPAPDETERRQIWQRMLPPSALQDSDIDIEWLAREHDLVGGEIRNAVYASHLIAAEDRAADRMTMRHCVAGLAREIGKTGRVINSPRLRGVEQEWEMPQSAY